ncbi:MAG TPA: hypothetical protein VII73_09440 [Caulobacteraceae bacterium]
MSINKWGTAGVVSLALAAMAGTASACAGAGVITRIVGKPQDIVILRVGSAGQRAPVARPRVLEVLCESDTIHAQNGAAATLSIDGAATVKVQAGESYTVVARKGPPTLAGNAYRNVSDHLLPDMKRQPWDVRLRGPGPALGFALTSLASGHQNLAAGSQNLLVRIDGGVGAYKVQLLDGAGSVLSQAAGAGNDIVLTRLNLAPGVYVLEAADSSGAKVEAKVTVVADRPPLSPDYDGIADREVQAAARAADLARNNSDTWSLQAEQVLNDAPTTGLDRESVFKLIESYGA